MAQIDLIRGTQLVVRMQYDDAIVVSQGYLDNLLTAIVQSLKSFSLLQYNVTLGARVNPERATTEQKDSNADCCTSQPPEASSDTVPQACQRNCTGGGITALTSSPTENYSYYAKTVLNHGSGERCLTILVEIFVNEKIDPSDSKHIIDSVTKSIDSCIVKQQKNPAAVSICVLNFVSSPNEDNKSKK